MSESAAPAENASDPDAFRARVRRERLAAREALDPFHHAEFSRRIEKQLLSVLREHAAKRQRAGHVTHVVAFCSPIRQEFDPRPLVTRLLNEHWQAVVPAVETPGAPMVWRHWRPDSPMSPDACGIPVPLAGESPLPDVVLLPLVAFDERGYRLGYGGGYFDRTLAAMSPRPKMVGVGFELGRVPSIHPQRHDLMLNSVVTEQGVMYYHGQHAQVAD